MSWDGKPPPVLGAQPPPLPPALPPSTPPPLSSVLLDARRQRTRLAEPLPARLASEPILTPHELDRFKNLLVFARTTVEGYFSGKHKSPYRGASTEFADYKEYVHGDEVARLDWRVYGRSRRLFVRQYEEETDMVVYLLVDVSASMSYAGEKRQSKYLLAAKIAAALAYLMTRQGDKAALALFADKVTQFLPPGGTRRHLHRVVTELERVKPASATGLARAISECNPLFKKRGKMVVISDFLTNRAEALEALGQFQHRRFDILLLHVVDPDELHLPPVNVAKFVDMETHEQVQVEPEEIREAFRENVRRSLEELACEADQRQISHAVVSTQNPYLEAIEAYLGFRGANTLFA